ncbi:MAG: FKBP-type peptidyl-prolyl cis-trans isomerase [Crocinitomicaceae bacterium]|nr:FKBP-type peptidyl-prolyl cis-trans isomerase [Crocinitomicaceae bacterium]
MKFLKSTPLFLILLFSCAEEVQEEPEIDLLDHWNQEVSSDMNATFAQEENAEIDAFLERRPDWNMTETGTGLRYMVYYNSESGDSAKVDDIAHVRFEISLLDGTICYTSEENGSESFMVEKTDVESGLHEGIKFMKAGDKAKFILPSHMAHGLIGDTDKIPPLSTVIYDIELIKVEKNESENS